MRILGLDPSTTATGWGLIDALANYFWEARWELLERLKNEHSMEAAVAVGPFDVDKFTRIAKGEPNPESS